MYIGSEHFETLKKKTVNEIGEHYKREPLSNGMLRETLREKMFAHKPAEIFKAVITALERERLINVENDLLRSASNSQKLTDKESAVIEVLRDIYTKAELEVPKLDDTLEAAVSGTAMSKEHGRKLLQILINSGEVTKVTNELYFGSAAITRLVEKLRVHAAEHPDRAIDVPKFKDIAGISRKYAIPLLEYFDGKKVTIRSGDRRIIL